MSSLKTLIAGLTAATVAVGITTAVPAFAQPQAGLVNVSVDVGGVLNNAEVAIPVAADIAANVCGITVPVAVLAQQVFRTGSYECSNDTSGDSVVVTQ